MLNGEFRTMNTGLEAETHFDLIVVSLLIHHSQITIHNSPFTI